MEMFSLYKEYMDELPMSLENLNSAMYAQSNKVYINFGKKRFVWLGTASLFVSLTEFKFPAIISGK